jgi:hypothetical protein
MKYFSLLFALAFLSLNCGDKETSEFCRKNVSFEFLATLENLQDTIYIADTLWLSISVDSLITDIETGTKYNLFANDEMQYWGLSVSSLDSIDLNAEVHFEYKNEQGELVPFQNQIFTQLYFQFQEEEGRRFAKIGIIPIKTGPFFFAFILSRNENNEFISVREEGCGLKTEHFFRTNKENIEVNNYHHVANSPVPENNEYPKENFDRVGGFAFVVIE